MPAQHHIDNDARLIITTWQGEAQDIDFIEALKKYQDDIQYHPDYINYNELVNLKEITNIKLTTNGLINIGKIASSTDHNEIGRKLAIVVGSNKAYFLARMYKVYRSLSQNSCKHISIFTKENEAIQWLQKST
ncbi:MAG: hypothetical protein OEY66_02085 [Gammaproteobacteria bacterium]|nr:hypothetical protein [Gammaproteobacteria bacterium]